MIFFVRIDVFESVWRRQKNKLSKQFNCLVQRNYSEWMKKKWRKEWEYDKYQLEIDEERKNEKNCKRKILKKKKKFNTIIFDGVDIKN